MPLSISYTGKPGRVEHKGLCFQLLLLTHPSCCMGHVPSSPHCTQGPNYLLFLWWAKNLLNDIHCTDCTQHIQCKKHSLSQNISLWMRQGGIRKFWLALITGHLFGTVQCLGNNTWKSLSAFLPHKTFAFYFCKGTVTCHKQRRKSMHCFLSDINSTPDL